MRTWLAGTVVAVMALLSRGWFTATYVAQAAAGQVRIAASARPIEAAVRDPALPESTRRLLAAVPSIKAFGQSQGVRPTANYEKFADVRRNAAAWVVQACSPLSLDAKRWRFPVVGSVPYLGFFEEAAAQRFAWDLSAREPLDVDVRTARAFSTLGWFRDPVLSTMLATGPEALGELANVVLHESVHATLYVNDQSAFDESLASFVADRLTVPWLESFLGPGAPETRAWTETHARDRARIARLHEAYRELETVYRSDRTDDEKRAAKARILDATTRALAAPRPLNNAALAGFRTYDAGVPAFERLLTACGGSWPRFLAALARLGRRDFATPQQEDFDAVVDRATAACGAS